MSSDGRLSEVDIAKLWNRVVQDAKKLTRAFTRQHWLKILLILSIVQISAIICLVGIFLIDVVIAEALQRIFTRDYVEVGVILGVSISFVGSSFLIGAISVLLLRWTADV